MVGIAAAVCPLSFSAFTEGVVASAIEWADRILAETEAWLATSQPLALK